MTSQQAEALIAAINNLTSEVGVINIMLLFVIIILAVK